MTQLFFWLKSSNASPSRHDVRPLYQSGGSAPTVISPPRTRPPILAPMMMPSRASLLTTFRWPWWWLYSATHGAYKVAITSKNMTSYHYENTERSPCRESSHSFEMGSRFAFFRFSNYLSEVKWIIIILFLLVYDFCVVLLFATDKDGWQWAWVFR